MNGMAVMGALGEWLDREFARRGWNQYDAAAALDLPVQTVNDLLRKPNKTPSPPTLRKLADGLAVSLERLFELIGQGSTRGGIPTESRAMPESVRGLSEGSFEYLSQMTPEELERWLVLLEQTRHRADQ